MNYFELNNGIKIPAVGTGTNTFGKVGNNYNGELTGDTTPLHSAFQLGYRLIDTAISYRIEDLVGKALQETDIDRTEFFVTTKIPNEPAYVANDEKVSQTVKASLQKLKVDYIDLYLIHHPLESLEKNRVVWKVLEKFVDSGQIRSIGVSNFNKEQLKDLVEHARIKPAIHQIESHPGSWNDDLIRFTQAQGIIAQAWGPLWGVNDPIIAASTTIGQKYNKSWAQVLLRYQLERQVAVIPKSHHVRRQQENIEIFDFQLDADDKEKIKVL